MTEQGICRTDGYVGNVILGTDVNRGRAGPIHRIKIILKAMNVLKSVKYRPTPQQIKQYNNGRPLNMTHFLLCDQQIFSGRSSVIFKTTTILFTGVTSHK